MSDGSVWVWPYKPLLSYKPRSLLERLPNLRLSRPDVRPGDTFTHSEMKDTKKRVTHGLWKPGQWDEFVDVETEVSHTYYRPTEAELSVIRDTYPDVEPGDPPWPQVLAYLKVAGHQDPYREEAPTLVELLKRATNTGADSSRSSAPADREPSGEVQAHPLSNGESDEPGLADDASATAAQRTEPDDLITTTVAVNDYHVSRKTLGRARDDGRIKSYRAESATPKSPHKYSKREIAKLWLKRRR